MSNFYCSGNGCKVVLNSRSERGDIKGLPYCMKCYEYYKLFPYLVVDLPKGEEKK